MGTLGKLLFAAAYTLVYVYLAVENAGAGHGTLLFFAPLLTWPFPVIATFLTARAQRRMVRVIFLLLMILHYGILLYALSGVPLNEVWQRWEDFPYFTLFTVLWYVFGQLVIWTLFIAQMLKNRSLK